MRFACENSIELTSHFGVRPNTISNARGRICSLDWDDDVIIESFLCVRKSKKYILHHHATGIVIMMTGNRFVILFCWTRNNGLMLTCWCTVWTSFRCGLIAFVIFHGQNEFNDASLPQPLQVSINIDLIARLVEVVYHCNRVFNSQQCLFLLWSRCSWQS